MRAFLQAQAQLLSEVESDLGSDIDSELESDVAKRQEYRSVFASLGPCLGGSCLLAPSRSSIPSQVRRPGSASSSSLLGIESAVRDEIEALTRHLILSVYEKPLDDQEVLAAVAAVPELAWLAECCSQTPLHGWSKLPVTRTARAKQSPRYQCDETHVTCETPPHFNFFVRLGKLIAHVRQCPGDTADALQWLKALVEEAKAEATSCESLWTGPHVDPTSGAEFFHCPSSTVSAWEFPGKGPWFVAYVAECLFGAEPFAQAPSSDKATRAPASPCCRPEEQHANLLESPSAASHSDAESFQTPSEAASAGRCYDLLRGHWDPEQQDAQPPCKVEVDMGWESLKELLKGSDAAEAGLASALTPPAVGMSPPQRSMAQAAVALSAARVTNIPGEASGSLQGTWAATVQSLTTKSEARQIQANLCQDTMLTWLADEIEVAKCPAGTSPTVATSLKRCGKLEAEEDSTKHLSVVSMDGDTLEVVDCYMSDDEGDTAVQSSSPLIARKSGCHHIRAQPVQTISESCSADAAESDAAAEVRALRSTVTKLAAQVAQLEGHPPSLSGQASQPSPADVAALWEAMATLEAKIPSPEQVQDLQLVPSLQVGAPSPAWARKPPRRNELEAVLSSRRRDVDQHAELFESEVAAKAQTAPRLSWQLMPMSAVAS